MTQNILVFQQSSTQTNVANLSNEEDSNLQTQRNIFYNYTVISRKED